MQSLTERLTASRKESVMSRWFVKLWSLHLKPTISYSTAIIQLIQTAACHCWTTQTTARHCRTDPRFLQSSYNILFSDGVSRLGLDPFFEVSVSKNSKVSGLGLEGFWSRSRALRLETLHRLFFMKFSKGFLKKTFFKNDCSKFSVRRGQLPSFLFCYVVCKMQKTIWPLPRLKFILNSI